MEIEGIGLINRCPAAMLDKEARFFMDLYTHYKNGFLPTAGGVLDQPSVFNKAMLIMDGTINKIRIHNEKEAQKNRDRGLKHVR